MNMRSIEKHFFDITVSLDLVGKKNGPSVRGPVWTVVLTGTMGQLKGAVACRGRQAYLRTMSLVHANVGNRIPPRRPAWRNVVETREGNPVLVRPD